MAEWMRFVETYLDKPSDTITDKTRKVHDDYIYDFVFDDGRIQNIYLVRQKERSPAIKCRWLNNLNKPVHPRQSLRRNDSGKWPTTGTGWIKKTWRGYSWSL